MSKDSAAIVNLAKVQFGDDEPLLYGVETPDELATMLLQLARNNYARSIEIRQFMEEHGLMNKGHENEISEILAQRHAWLTRDHIDDSQSVSMRVRPSRGPGRPWWKRVFEFFR